MLSFWVGCTSENPLQLATMNEKQLQDVSTKSLVNYYGIYRTDDKVKAEIVRRGIFNDKDWAIINKQQIKVGMSEYALIASWGDPEKVKTTANTFGETKQFYYGRSNDVLVNLRDGKVTSWQE